MKKLWVGAILTLFFVTALSEQTHAISLKVAPLQYKTTLAKGELKRGFIDISNPSSYTVSLKVSVRGFKQINDNGGLQFFNDKQLELGIRPELQELELGPRQAVRMYFTVNSNVLPKGDVYSAIFFTTNVKNIKNGIGQSVRVGTLLSIVNETPGDRYAKITGLTVPFLQFTDTLKGSYVILNTGNSQSGFYPEVDIRLWPDNTSKKSRSSLLFGGRERSNDFTYETGLGFHRVEVSYDGSSKTRWVLILNSGIAIALLFVAAVIFIEVILWRHRKRKRTKRKH